MLPRDSDHQQAARVVGVIRNNEGQIIGEFIHNPILNTKVYEVMFPDGAVHQYAAKTIAENIHSQVDEEGHQYQLMDHISNHKSYGRAFPKSEAFTVSINRNRARKKTTKGCYLGVQWKDGLKSWVPLWAMKESHGIQTIDYEEANEFIYKPAFAWWDPFTVNKKDKIIAKVKYQMKKVIHNYGLEVPRNITHTYELDYRNNNTLCADAINK